MNEKIRRHMDQLFEDAPKTKRALELKEEMTQNAIEKYQDLLNQGFGEEDAYQSVVRSIGDVTELFEQLEVRNLLVLSEADRRKKAKLTAAAIGLYIFAGVAFFACVFLDSMSGSYLDWSLLGLVLAGAICICPTCMLVYASHMYPDYQKKEEESKSMVEEFKEYRYSNNKDKAVMKAVSSIIWTMTLIVYFLVSFLTMSWYITWVIFLMGGCLQAIAGLIFSLKKEA